MLYYVNEEEISHVPSSYRRYHGTDQANRAELMAVGSHNGTKYVCVCVFVEKVSSCMCLRCVSARRQPLVVCVCSCMSILIHLNIPRWFAQSAGRFRSSSTPSAKNRPMISPSSLIWATVQRHANTTCHSNYEGSTDYSMTQNMCVPFSMIGSIAFAHEHSAAP